MHDNNSPFTIEIATSDFESTKNAVAGGADRIELCANLGEGGTTQSFGVIKTCREHFDVKLYPIIRVRGGDFLYTDEEYECMLQDAKMCKQLGCDGVVIGFLHKDGTIDEKRTAAIVEALYPLKVTFHRAFDRCINPFTSLEKIINAGCERILTSGQQLTAPEGAALIAGLQDAANGRITIMPGSGVRASNIKQLAESTGCTEFHTSLRELQRSNMEYFPSAFLDSEENNHYTVYKDNVAALRKALAS